MPGRIRDFLRGQEWPKSREHMNRIVGALNQVGTLKGDGLIQVSKVGSFAYSWKLNLEGLLALIPRPSQLLWGKALAAWTTGNAVTLTPCEADGAGLPDEAQIKAYIISPTGGNPADEGLKPVIAEGDILPYLALDPAQGVLLGVKWNAKSATAIDKVLDVWVDVTQATAKTYIDAAADDWRGQTLWYSVRICEETPADADDDEWDDDAADYQDVRCIVVGCDWDLDADEGPNVQLWADDVQDTTLWLEETTGRLFIICCWGGVRHQLRVTVRATAAKASTDAGVPDIVI